MSQARLRALAPKQPRGVFIWQVDLPPTNGLPSTSQHTTGLSVRSSPSKRRNGIQDHLLTLPPTPRDYAVLPPSHRLSQELIDMIIDEVAFTYDRDVDFPTRPFLDLSTCCLVSRAWLHCCSCYLLGRFYFGPRRKPRSREPQSEEEGRVIMERLYGFLEYAGEHSSRLRRYVTGLSIEWGPGMDTPLTYELVSLIFSSLPNLTILRLAAIPPWPSPVIRMPAPSVRREISSLNIGISKAAGSAQAWLFEQLRLFRRIDALQVTKVSEIAAGDQIAVTRHLQVETLHLEDSGLTVLQALERLITPSSVSTLSIKHRAQWGTPEGTLESLNSFLKSRRQHIKTFFLHCTTCQSITLIRPHKPTTLHALAQCTVLDLVRVKLWHTGWSFQELCRDVLSCLPRNIPRIRIEYLMHIYPFQAEVAELVDWPYLAKCLALYPSLLSVELDFDCGTIELFAGPQNEHVAAEDQEKAYLAMVVRWLKNQQHYIIRELSRRDKAITSLTFRYQMDRCIRYEDIRREVVYRVDSKTVHQVYDYAKFHT